MSQNIIDTGQAANDGTGEPLRQAFTAINDNFSNIWAQGPVDSQVVISNNTVTTNETNLDLVLSANGIGNVTVNSTVVPGVNSVYDLGAADAQFDTVWARYYNAGTGNFSGDVTVNGNLTVVGNTIQIGNITTETKTIQLSNAASTANAADGSGVTVGANDNIATMLYSSTSNTWVMNIGANITGNVTAPYFIGNGSQLTGITSYANANAVAYANSGWAGNIIPSADNTYSLGNATNQWSDLYVSNATIYMNNIPVSLTAGNVLTVNGQAILSNDSNTTINTTGNITADYFFGDGSQLTGIQTTGNIEFLGTTMYIDPDAPDTQINISPDGEGWAYLQLPNNATANSANTRLHNDAGNVEIGTGDFSTGSSSYSWYFDNTGNLNLPTNGSINVNGGSIVQTPDENFKIVVQDAENDGWALQLEVTDGTAVGSRIEQTVDQVQIGTGLAGTSYYWQFDDNGRLVVPGDIWGTYNGNLSVLARGVTDSSFVEIATQDNSDIKRSNVTVTRDNVTVTTSSGAYNWSFGVDGTLITPGDIHLGNGVAAVEYNAGGNRITITSDTANNRTGASFTLNADANVYANANVRITSDSGTTAKEWLFDNTGVLTLPGGNINFNPTNDYLSINTLNGGAIEMNDGVGNIGAVGLEAGENAFITVGINDGPQVTWTFDGNGNLTVPGNIVSNDTILIDNRESGVIADISIYSADNILLQGADRTNPGEPEGGDINIYAGSGAADNGTGGTGGGDIQIAGGPGGAANTSPGGFGGTVDINGGNGGDGSATARASGGGSISITAGNGGADNGGGGYTGGGVFITAGDSTDSASDRGSIVLTSGAGGDETTVGGYVQISIPASGTNPGGQWTFTGTGLTLEPPPNGEIFSPNTGNLTVGTVGNTIVRNIGGVTTYDWVFSDTGTLTLPGEGVVRSNDDTIILQSFDSANNIGRGLRVGTSGQLFLEQGADPAWLSFVANSGNAEISAASGTSGAAGHSLSIAAGSADQTDYYATPGGNVNISGGAGAFNDGGGGGQGGSINIAPGLSADPAGVPGNVNLQIGNYAWAFDYTGNLTLPSNTFTVNYANGTAVSLGGNYGNAEVADFLDSLGSNAIVTTGNISGGNLNATTGVANVANLYMNTGYVNTAASAALNLVPGGSGGTRVWSKLVPNANVAFSLGSSTEYWANGYIGNVIATTGNFTGNVTAANFTGNISITGNVTGTSANVTLVAGSYSAVFDNTGVATFPGDLKGDILISTNSSGSEGGEIQLSLPTAGNTTLSGTNVIIDSYSDRIRFFEGGGNGRGMYIDLANSPDGQVNAAIGYRDVPQITLGANVTANLTNAGKHFYSTTAGNLAVLIPTNANVAFPTGATLTLVVNAAGNVLVNADTGVSLYMAGSSTTGNRTVGAYGLASVMKVATDTWVISGTGVY